MCFWNNAKTAYSELSAAPSVSRHLMELLRYSQCRSVRFCVYAFSSSTICRLCITSNRNLSDMSSEIQCPEVETRIYKCYSNTEWKLVAILSARANFLVPAALASMDVDHVDDATLYHETKPLFIMSYWPGGHYNSWARLTPWKSNRNGISAAT